MANAKIDDNYKKTLTAITDDANATISRLLVDPTTGRLKVSAIITSGQITSLNALTTATQLFAVGSSGNQFNISSSGSTHTFNLPTASASGTGQLIASDWSVFMSKGSAVSYSLPLSISGTTVSISKASASGSGYLIGEDWTVFQSKGSVLGFNLPLSVSGTIVSISQAGASGSGYLISGDWNTFNNKIGGTGQANYHFLWTSASAGGTSQIYESGGSIGLFTTTPTGIFQIGSSGSLTMLSNGNVGIGTTGPTQLLTIGTQNSKHGYLRLLYGNAAGEGNICADDTYGIHMDTASNARPIRLDGSKIELMPSGNVGIGTTTPTYKLAVEGSGSITSLATGSITASGTIRAEQGVQFNSTAYFDEEFANGNSGSVGTTISWQNGNKQSITLTGSGTITMVMPPGTSNLSLRLIQDATSARTIVWSPLVKWSGGSILSTGSSAIDIANFYWPGSGGSVYGMLSTNFVG